MARRTTARELERAGAAARPLPPPPPRPPGGEAVAMLVRRGLSPRATAPDLPFPPDLPEAAVERIARRLGHYAFRLFLRGAILRPAGFAPGEPSRYLGASAASRMAEELVALGLAERLPRGRYRLRRRARSFGGALEWYLGRELNRRLGFDVALGLRSGAAGVGGDLDVVAAAEGKLVYLEVKSSPPKHIARAEVAAFLRRVRALRPDVALFVVDTALRLGDKVVPMLAAELGGEVRPRRVLREIWAVTPHLFAVNARQDLVDNVRRAVAQGLAALAPPFPEPPGRQEGRRPPRSSGRLRSPGRRGGRAR